MLFCSSSTTADSPPIGGGRKERNNLKNLKRKEKRTCGGSWCGVWGPAWSLEAPGTPERRHGAAPEGLLSINVIAQYVSARPTSEAPGRCNTAERGTLPLPKNNNKPRLKRKLTRNSSPSPAAVGPRPQPVAAPTSSTLEEHQSHEKVSSPSAACPGGPGKAAHRRYAPDRMTTTILPLHQWPERSKPLTHTN